MPPACLGSLCIDSWSAIVFGAAMWAKKLTKVAGSLALVALAQGGCSLGGLEGGDAGPDAHEGDVSDASGCNGDCDSSACKSAGFACTSTPVPAGWTLVAYSADDRPICP